jgi:hypothetical protein
MKSLSIGDMYDTIGSVIYKSSKGRFFKNRGIYGYIIEYYYIRFKNE